MVIELNHSNFENEVLESELPFVVDFWAAWCGPCRALGTLMENLANEFKDKAQFGKLNIDTNKGLVEKYRIINIPCMIIFCKGKEIDRITGFPGEESVREKISAALSKI